MGRANEVGVDARRAMSGAAVLDEFRQVTAERLAQLRRLTPGDLAAQTATPVGPGTVADLLTLRVMDSWSHEKDIRRAVGRPGHTGGPAVEEAVAYFSRFLPYLVGKRAAAPDGAKVVFRIGARPPVAVEVAGGRGRLAADRGDATVDLAIPVTTFAALVGGRCDVPGDTGHLWRSAAGPARAGVDGLPALTPGPSRDLAGRAAPAPGSRRTSPASCRSGTSAFDGLSHAGHGDRRPDRHMADHRLPRPGDQALGQDDGICPTITRAAARTVWIATGTDAPPILAGPGNRAQRPPRNPSGWRQRVGLSPGSVARASPSTNAGVDSALANRARWRSAPVPRSSSRFSSSVRLRASPRALSAAWTCSRRRTAGYAWR